MIKNLILRDVSRCSDSKCLKSNSCKRYLQRDIDYKNNETYIPVNNFKGSENNGLCEFFLDVKEK